MKMTCRVIDGELTVNLIPTDHLDSALLKGFTVTVEGDPIVRMPFYLHGDNPKNLHTICSRTSDDIETRNW